MGSYERAREAANRRQKKRRNVRAATTFGWVKDGQLRKYSVLDDIRLHITAASLERDKDRDISHVHPSDMADSDWCGRRTQYRIMGLEPDEGVRPTFWRLAGIYEEGHSIHEKYQSWLWDMGVLEGMWRCNHCRHDWWALAPAVCPACGGLWVEYREVPISLPDHHVIGHADGVYCADGNKRVLLEIKSIGINSIKFSLPGVYQYYKDGETVDQLWGRIQSPFPSHVRQVQIYMHDLHTRIGVEEALLLYEFKGNQDTKSFTVSYNEKMALSLLSRADTVMGAVSSGEVLPRPSWARSSRSKQCKGCPYKGTCWGDKGSSSKEA